MKILLYIFNHQRSQKWKQTLEKYQEADVAIKDIVNRTTESREGTDSEMNWRYWT